MKLASRYPQRCSYHQLVRIRNDVAIGSGDLFPAAGLAVVEHGDLGEGVAVFDNVGARGGGCCGRGSARPGRRRATCGHTRGGCGGWRRAHGGLRRRGTGAGGRGVLRAGRGRVEREAGLELVQLERLRRGLSLGLAELFFEGRGFR